MAFIQFTNQDKVNVKLIDKQHQSMVKIINKIHSNLEKEHQYNCTSDMQNLIDEIEIHFETEERLMKENNFMGYYSHKLEHDRFFNQVTKNFDLIKKGNPEILLEQLSSIKRWFYNHLDLSDKKCGTFLNSIGIK